MSIKVMSAIWMHSTAAGSALLVLLALADRADDEGVAYPAVSTLAKKARMSIRNVQYVLRDLEKAGELVVEKNAGPKGCNLFRVKTLHGVQSVQGEAGFAEGVQPASPKGCNPLHPIHQGFIKDSPEAGADGAASVPALTLVKSKTQPRKAKIPLDAFLAACRAAGEKPIRDDDPVLAYAEQAGLPPDWIVLAWDVFKDKYRAPNYHQADWRAHFRNSVKGNWGKLWGYGPESKPFLTQVGKQAERVYAAA